MTREEAVEQLRNLKKANFFSSTIIALDMAIEALSNADQHVQHVGCVDLISRQAVFDTLDRMDKAITGDDRSVETYKELLTECIKDLPVPVSGDLISRQDAIDAIENTDAEITAEEWDELTNAINELPSADAVEVIRCKDCKNYIPYEWMFDDLSRSSNMDDYAPDEIGCSVNDHNYPPYGFCSFAERRTE